MANTAVHPAYREWRSPAMSPAVPYTAQMAYAYKDGPPMWQHDSRPAPPPFVRSTSYPPPGPPVYHSHPRDHHDLPEEIQSPYIEHGFSRPRPIHFHPYFPPSTLPPNASPGYAYPPHQHTQQGSSATSQASGSASADALAKMKPKRKRITGDQLETLVALFEKTDTPSFDVREEVGAKLKMTNREVQVWFQNRRAKVNRMKSAPASDKDRSASPADVPAAPVIKKEPAAPKPEPKTFNLTINTASPQGPKAPSRSTWPSVLERPAGDADRESSVESNEPRSAPAHIVTFPGGNSFQQRDTKAAPVAVVGASASSHRPRFARHHTTTSASSSMSFRSGRLSPVSPSFSMSSSATPASPATSYFSPLPSESPFSPHLSHFGSPSLDFGGLSLASPSLSEASFFGSPDDRRNVSPPLHEVEMRDAPSKSQQLPPLLAEHWKSLGRNLDAGAQSRPVALPPLRGLVDLSPRQSNSGHLRKVSSTSTLHRSPPPSPSHSDGLTLPPLSASAIRARHHHRRQLQRPSSLSNFFSVMREKEMRVDEVPMRRSTSKDSANLPAGAVGLGVLAMAAASAQDREAE